MTRLTETSAAEELTSYSPDGNYCAFVRDHDLYIVEIGTSSERRLTEGGSDILRHGKADWVYFEEIKPDANAAGSTRAYLGGHSGARAPRHHEGCENRTQLADGARPHQPSDVDGRSELLHFDGGLQGQHHAREQPRQQYDPDGPHADRVHLDHQVSPIERPRQAAVQGPAEKPEVLLGVERPALERVVDVAQWSAGRFAQAHGGLTIPSGFDSPAPRD